MKKGSLFLFVLAFIIAGGVFAEANSTVDLNSGFQFSLLADEAASAFSPALTGTPLLAGLANMPFGLWSWMNKDWVGGGITAGLELIGVVSAVLTNVAGAEFFSNHGGKLFVGCLAGFIAGPIYGYFRGSGQCRDMNAASLAEALGDNPLNHISMLAFPAFDGRGAAGSLTYSVQF